MAPYMFVIHSVPSPSNQHFETVRYAKVHIWVMDDDGDSALNRARSYIAEQNWQPLQIEYGAPIPPELLPQLDTEEARLYLTALQYGIAADFVAAPVTDRPGSGIQLLRP